MATCLAMASISRHVLKAWPRSAASASRARSMNRLSTSGRCSSPTPVHAYMVAMRREDGTYATPQLRKKPPPLPPSAPPIPPGEKFAADTVPFVGDRTRITLANEYVPAADYKALALNNIGINFFVAGQQNEEAARSAALEQCQKRADAVQAVRRCEIYAVGNNGGLPAWPAAGAAFAMDQARPVNREAVRGKGHAACPRHRKDQA
jgi:hypothetical protein